MSSFRSLLRLDALPASPDLGLLLLRVGIGGSMAILHGMGKFQDLMGGRQDFGDPLGVGSIVSLVGAVGGEFVAALLLVAGLATRWAALLLAFVMAVAFFAVHGGRLTGEGNGEMAFLYLGASLVLLATGAGRFSVDAKLGQTR